eukprot:10823768-Lingulodinium_polyedra.AAC.1
MCIRDRTWRTCLVEVGEVFVHLPTEQHLLCLGLAGGFGHLAWPLTEVAVGEDIILLPKTDEAATF